MEPRLQTAHSVVMEPRLQTAHSIVMEPRLQTAHSIVMERRRLEKQTTDRAQHRHGTKTTQGSDLNKYKGTKLANFSNLTPESQNIKLH